MKRNTAQKTYRKEKVQSIYIDLFPTDEDIKNRLSERKAVGEGRATYIKRLIREDIARK